MGGAANKMPEQRRTLSMAAALLICLCAGFGYAWSVIQTPIMEQHGWSGAQVSAAYPLTVLCSTMSPLLCGAVIRKLGVRRCTIVGALLFGAGLILCSLMKQVWQLYLFYGVMTGLGVGFIYPGMMAYVVRLYPERSGAASGLGTAAYGSGAILWAPSMVALSDALSLSRAFCILGIGFLAVILFCAAFLHEPSQVAAPAEHTAPSAAGLRRCEMVRTTAFYLMVAVFTCALVAGTIVISQASPILRQTLDYTAAQAAVFVSVFAACNMAGRFLWGGLSDKLGLRVTINLIFLLCILSMVSLAFARQPLPVLCAMGIAASCYGGFASVLTPMTARMFGTGYIGENYGVMYVVFGIASLIGPSLAVNLQTADGYTGAFLAAAALAATGLAGAQFLKPQCQQPVQGGNCCEK